MIMSNIDNLSNIGYLNNSLVKKSMQRAGREIKSKKTPHLNQLIMNLSGGNQQKGTDCPLAAQ
ncbi:hypothetical protein GCM10020331_095330 [Ectobacillus funiculus]